MYGCITQAIPRERARADLVIPCVMQSALCAGTGEQRCKQWSGEPIMPLTTDEKLLTLSREVIAGFDKAAGGVRPGFRPGHAKGLLLTGVFTPSSEAASLTRAPHLQRQSTPVTVRFSDFAGVPTVPDNDPQGASPRRVRDPLPSCRACAYGHREPLGRRVPDAHGGSIPGLPQ